MVSSSPKSVQGQVLLRYFDGNTDELDKQIRKSLGTQHFTEAVSPWQQKAISNRYLAKVSAHGKNFYFLSDGGVKRTRKRVTDLGSIQKALAGLWNFIARRGEIGDLVSLPLVRVAAGSSCHEKRS